METKADVIVIGAGPAGMMAAISAAKAGAKALLLEKNTRPGRKLMITGKGRCNVTNDCTVQEAIASVVVNPRFLYSAFSAFSPEDTKRFFEEAGVPLKTERGKRVFPQSDKAVDIVDAMQRELKKSGVSLRNETVKSLWIEENTLRGVLTVSGKKLPARCVIIACGGLSYPQTGSTGDGYRLAKQAGHTVTPQKPSLVPIVSKDPDCARMQGLSLRNVGVKVIDQKKQKELYEDFGEMLFTHFGVSGPVILSAGSHIREMEPGRYLLRIDLKPALSEEKLDLRLQRELSEQKNKNFENMLGALLPKKMIPVVIDRSGIPGEEKCNAITRAQRAALLAALKKFEIVLDSFRPIAEAIVTSGGVDVRGLDPASMASKMLPGLYFAGEVIDVDAYTGGFNLQIAFSTGFIAGKAAAQAARANAPDGKSRESAGGLSEAASRKSEPKDDQKQTEKNEAKGRKTMQKNEACEKRAKINVAIDGPAGAGKSSVAKAAAKALGFIYVDTGALYRAVGFFAVSKGIDPKDAEAVPAAIGREKPEISIRFLPDGQHVFLNGEDIEAQIRTPQISMAASDVSAIPAVRAFLFDLQRDLARENAVIMDGRDIGTVVLPEAQVKIFLTASAEERAKRRMLQLREKGDETPFETLLEEIKKRDDQDMNRAIAPLKAAPDAVTIDSSDLSFEAVCERVETLIREKTNAGG